MKFYRVGFFVAMAVILALVAGLAYLAVRPRARGSAPVGPAAAPSYVVASGPPVGSRGAAGAAATSNPDLAPVQLAPAALQRIGVEVGRVAYGPVTETIRTVGNVALDQRRLAAVQVRFAGWVTHEYADQDYQYIRRGQPLVTIYSPEVVASEEAYLVARQNRDLLAGSTVPGVASGAGSLLAASQERLAQWQVPPAEIARLRRSGRALRTITLDAPVSGYIFARAVLPNQYVHAGTTLYQVANLSDVWVNAQVFQNQAGMLRLREAASVTVDAYPGRVFHGQVDYINPVVETATRTMPVRLVMPNPGRKLTPGMFVNAVIQVPLGRQLTIPANAVLQTGTQNIVFVDQGGGNLVPKDVQLGPRLSRAFVVRKGLQPGQRIVTSANFLIDSESQLQAALGAYSPPPPGVGANAQPPRAAQPPQARIALTTQPAPPGAGANHLAVRLAGAGGHGIAGAQVTVRFLMPAMPAMGMAAEHAEAVLRDQGGGNYAGVVQLPSGGHWEVVVTASRHGQVIARRQLQLSGGS
ncbi:MAG: efflux RND transporter periplasmic adaptor subunit [Terriglobales bacterium]